MAMNWAKNYAPVVYNYFMTGVQMVPSLIPRLFNVQTTASKKNYRVGVGGMSTEVWSEYSNTGITGHGDIDRGYATTFECDPFTARVSLLKSDLKEPNGISIYQSSIQGFGISAAQKRETDAAAIFNNAFSGSYLGADGVALCSASHPYGPDDTGNVYSNYGTAAFNYANLKAARLAMRQLVDQQGNPMFRNGTLVLLPLELNDTAKEIIDAQAKPGGADNDANAVSGFDFVQWDYLSDAESWWLLDQIWMKQHLLWFDRSPLSMMVVDETTTDITYEFHMEYVTGWSDPRFVYGNAV